MSIDPTFLQILNYPGIHNHDDDKENLHQEKFRQNLKKNCCHPTQLLKTVYNYTLERTNGVVPEFHNVFEKPANIRTTNDLKGWNNAWGRTTRRASPNIWLAVKFLCQQENLVENVLLNLKIGSPPRP